MSVFFNVFQQEDMKYLPRLLLRPRLHIIFHYKLLNIFTLFFFKKKTKKKEKKRKLKCRFGSA